MTKAERIRKLAEQHPKWGPKQIAAKCDCGDSYVRTVLRQRVGGKRSEHDKRYAASEKGRKARQATIENFIAEHGCYPSTLAARNSPEIRARRYQTYRRWVGENMERRRAYARQWQRDYRARKKAERQASAPA